MPLDYLDEETIIDLTSQLWSALVADGDDLMPSPAAGERLRSSEALVASIDIAGTPKTRIEVACTRRLAEAVAAAMFATSADELEEAAVFDALGEVVNIVGGNVKALFIEEAGLSLPSLRVENGLPPTTTGSTCLATFLWRDEPLAVRVTEAEEAIV